MEPDRTTCKSRDMLANPRQAMAIFWAPAIAMVVAGNSRFSGHWRTIIWTAALAVMGSGCVVNARRCGRVHCYITGPFFLVMAVVALSYGLGIMPLGRRGWDLIGLTVLAGAIVLCCLPEMILGRYRSAGDEPGARK